MAAVDVDIRQVKKMARAVAKHAAGERKDPSPSLATGQQQQQEEEKGDFPLHEHVLCSIKVHQNGTLQVAPGASNGLMARTQIGMGGAATVQIQFGEHVPPSLVIISGRKKKPKRLLA